MSRTDRNCPAARLRLFQSTPSHRTTTPATTGSGWRGIRSDRTFKNRSRLIERFALTTLAQPLFRGPSASFTVLLAMALCGADEGERAQRRDHEYNSAVRGSNAINQRSAHSLQGSADPGPRRPVLFRSDPRRPSLYLHGPPVRSGCVPPSTKPEERQPAQADDPAAEVYQKRQSRNSAPSCVHELRNGHEHIRTCLF